MPKSNDEFILKCYTEYSAQLQRCNKPHAVAEEVLNDILDQLDYTVFAHDHNLKNISTLQQFKSAVPIRTYQKFDKYIDLMLRGAQNVLTKSDFFAFYKTSGTSGKSKYIPATYHWRQEYRGPALYAQWGLYFKLINMEKLVPGNVLDLSWSRKGNKSNLDMAAYRITNRPSALDGKDWLPPWYESDWFVSSEAADYTEAVLDMLTLATLNDVRIIVAVNPSKIVHLYEVINENLDLFVRKLEARFMHQTNAQITRILSLLCIRKSSGIKVSLIDLWPNLGLVVCWRSASAGKYISWLNVAAPGVPVIPFSTVGTEGIVTIPIDSGVDGSALGINQGIYEFVDTNELEDPAAPLSEKQSTINFNEVKIGHRYRLVMTQANGIYRYDTQDVYEVVGWAGAVPRLEFVGRSNVTASFTGEKLTEDDVFAAVRVTLHNTSPILPFFTCIPYWANPPFYIFAIEAGGSEIFEAHNFLEARLQDELSNLNEEYAEKCRTKRLAPLQLLLLQSGAFKKLSFAGIEKGISAAQVKHLWIQPNSNILEKIDVLNLQLRSKELI